MQANSGTIRRRGGDGEPAIPRSGGGQAPIDEASRPTEALRSPGASKPSPDQPSLTTTPEDDQNVSIDNDIAPVRQSLHTYTGQSTGHPGSVKDAVPPPTEGGPARPTSPARLQSTDPPDSVKDAIRPPTKGGSAPAASPTILSAKDKLGVVALVFLSAGPILTLAALGFLCFLWFGDAGNQFWREIMVQNWLNQAVAICAEAIKLAVNFELGVVVAMTAAIVLERGSVLLPDVAQFSLMRATASSGSIWIMFWHQLVAAFTTKSGRLWVLILPMFLLVCLYGLTQVASILLLSDVGLTLLPGVITSGNLSIGLFDTPDDVIGMGYVPGKISWDRKAEFFPAFAEYSEPPYVADGVSDTGMSLRAFLPFNAAQDRQSLLQYSGYTTVVDTRVSCQIPSLEGLQTSLVDGTVLLVEGRAGASRYTPRLGNATYFGSNDSNTAPQANTSVPFSCLALNAADVDSIQLSVSICQLPEGGTGLGSDVAYAGGLVSQFQDISSWYNVSGGSNIYGTAYLLLNRTTTTTGEQWYAALNQSTTNLNDSDSPALLPPPTYRERDEWLDLGFGNESAVLSLTLCYSAFRQATLPVQISSSSNRTEPTPILDTSESKLTYSSLRKQMGQYGGSPEDRGVLQMKNQSWITQDDDWTTSGTPQPGLSAQYLRRYVDLDGESEEAGNAGNISAVMFDSRVTGDQNKTGAYTMNPDITHIWLFQEILATGGSAAFALQTMITLLSGMGYYDGITLFDHAMEVQYGFQVAANAPLKFRGFATVAATVVVQLCTTFLILRWFLRHTQYSRLGASWAAITQCSNGEAAEYIDKADAMGDSDVREMMQRDHMHRSLARVRHRNRRIGIGLRMKDE